MRLGVLLTGGAMFGVASGATLAVSSSVADAWCAVFKEGAKCRKEKHCVQRTTDCWRAPAEDGQAEGELQCVNREQVVGWCGAKIETLYKDHHEKFAPIVYARATPADPKVAGCQALFQTYSVKFDDLLNGRWAKPPASGGPECTAAQLQAAAGSVETLHAFAQLLYYSPLGRRMRVSGLSEIGIETHLAAVNGMLAASKHLRAHRDELHDLFVFGALVTRGYGSFRASAGEKKMLSHSLSQALKYARGALRDGVTSEHWTGFLSWIMDLTQALRSIHPAASVAADEIAAAVPLSGFIAGGIEEPTGCSLAEFAGTAETALAERFKGDTFLTSVAKHAMVEAIKQQFPRGLEDLAPGFDGNLEYRPNVIGKAYLQRQALIAAVDAIARNLGDSARACLVRGLKLLDDGQLADLARDDDTYREYLTHVSQALGSKKPLAKKVSWLLYSGPFRP